jgi:acetyl-CoA carboxylase/biotin carboxylase 1
MGVNLPAAQLQAAMGNPPYRNKDIRQLYGVPRHGSSAIDFDFETPESQQLQRKPQPQTAPLLSVSLPRIRTLASNHLWAAGAQLPLEYECVGLLFCRFNQWVARIRRLTVQSHIRVWCRPWRGQELKNMVVAPKEMGIRGDFRTTVEYLIKLLQTDAFEGNSFTT